MLSAIAQLCDERPSVARRDGPLPTLDMDQELEGVCTPPDSPKGSMMPMGTTCAPLEEQQGEQQQQQPQQQQQEEQQQQVASDPAANQELPSHSLYINAAGKLQVRVYDTLEIRAAFLHYCNSACRPDEMHRIQQPPLMNAHQFMSMCKDLQLAEPTGKRTGMQARYVFTQAEEAVHSSGLVEPTPPCLLLHRSLECRAAVTYDARPDICNATREAGQRPVLHWLHGHVDGRVAGDCQEHGCQPSRKIHGLAGAVQSGRRWWSQELSACWCASLPSSPDACCT